MSAPGSVTCWLDGLRAGDAAAVQVAEQCRRLLDRLGDDDLRALAVWKMEGYTNAEIAAKLGRSLATVERKLKLIRLTWEAEAPNA